MIKALIFFFFVSVWEWTGILYVWLRELGYCQRRGMQGREEEGHRVLACFNRSIYCICQWRTSICENIKKLRKIRCKLNPLAMGFWNVLVINWELILIDLEFPVAVSFFFWIKQNFPYHFVWNDFLFRVWTEILIKFSSQFV